MTTLISQHPGDGPIPPSLRAPLLDEDALHDAFVAEYSALTAEARGELGTEAVSLTPKVVEGSFVRAWDAREKLRTPAELHHFLVEDVHHAAARALSRRATAHRFAGHEPAQAKHAGHAIAETSMEQSWVHVLHALHGEAHSPEALTQAAALSRHEAAGHIATIEKGPSIWKVLAVLALVAGGMVGAVATINYLGADAKIGTAVNAADARVITSLPGQIGVVTLDDGSTVRLAPESRLSIPKGFGASVRAVKLEGAGTFSVAAGQSQSFQVHARDAVVVATGTAFTVRRYESDAATIVVVQDGTVDVRSGGTRQALGAGGALILTAGLAPRAASPAERDQAAAWNGGTLVMSGRPLRDVLPELRRWYGLTVSVPQAALLERSVTLRASLDSSRQAIQGIEQSTGLEFGYIGPNMVFREKAALARTGTTKR